MKRFIILILTAVFMLTACNSDLKKAKQYKEQGDWANAQEYYLKVVKASPKNARYHNELGYVYQKRGFYDLAVKEFKQAIALNNTYVEAFYNLGSVQFKMFRYPEAQQAFEKVIKMDPNNAKAINNLALVVFLNEKDADRALELYQKAINLEPGNPVFHENLADFYERTGKPDKAKEERDKAEALKATKPR